MNRRRWMAASAPAALFSLLLWTACYTPLPQIPDGFELQAPCKTGRFILYGDTRQGAPLESVIRKTDYASARDQLNRCLLSEAPDLIIHSGDIVARASSEGLWREWDHDTADLAAAHIPLYLAWGNHEYWGDDGEAALNIARRFPHLLGRHWYSVRYGPLLLAILDSNFDELATEAIVRQDAWLDRTLLAADTDTAISTVFLVAHHAPYTNSRVHKPDPLSQIHFVERARKHPKVRTYIAGHVHNYERFFRDGIQFVVAGGGGAPKTSVNVKSPAFEEAYRNPDEIRPFQYCMITVEEKRIVVDVIMLDEKDGSWYRGDGFVIE